MSGTSADSIDVVAVDFSSSKPSVIAYHETPLSTAIQGQIVDLSTGHNDSLHDALVLDQELGIAFAEAVNALLGNAELDPGSVVAIGSHGQTLRHQVQTTGANDRRFTLQVGDPNIVAELTGIKVVGDFRRRDIAAGGQAAPLAPGFHHHFFSHADTARAIVNIGGFTNLSLLVPGQDPIGFDSGPGNCLMDGWINRIRGLPFDRDGQWAVEGRVNNDLLQRLKAHNYFQEPAPKSTGRELFNLEWVDRVVSDVDIEAVDVQSTLMQLTVDTLVDALDFGSTQVSEVYICGGGAQNSELLSRLREASGLVVDTTTALGVDPKLVEGCAFAWMAKQTLNATPSNLPSVTGAKGSRILGGIYQA